MNNYLPKNESKTFENKVPEQHIQVSHFMYNSLTFFEF